MLDLESILIIVGTLVGTQIVTSVTNFFIQKHFIKRLESFYNRKADRR
jgi:hypothetical protein